MAAIVWDLKPFGELGPERLYALLALRQRVFVVEQACAFQEADGLDPLCRHLTGWKDGRLLACARLVPAGLKTPERAIGRVATAPEARGTGLGRTLMIEAIGRLMEEDAVGPIRLGAQLYLEKTFYEPLGFRRFGEPYDEDGIPHVDMMLRPDHAPRSSMSGGISGSSAGGMG